MHDIHLASITLPSLSRVFALARAHYMLFFTWGTFFVAAIISFGIEYFAEKQTLSLRGFLTFCFPWNSWKSASTRIDIIMYFVGKFTDAAIGSVGLLFSGFLAVGIAHLLQSVLPVAAHPAITAVSAIFLGLAFFLAVDFANYSTHLMEHKVPFFWEFHKVHHSANFLTPFTTARIHPLEKVVDTTASSLLVGLVAGYARYHYNVSFLELMGLAAASNTIATLIVLDSLRHSQFPVGFGPFDRLLLSPHMHHVHHSVKPEHWDKNMGNKLSMWDWIFRTGFKPTPGEPLEFGTGHAEDLEYHSVVGSYVMPFVKATRLLRTGSSTPVEPQPQATPNATPAPQSTYQST